MRRLLAAVRVVPRVLRADFWTVAADPLPPLASWRWPARLPHAVVMVYAALALSSGGPSCNRPGPATG